MPILRDRRYDYMIAYVVLLIIACCIIVHHIILLFVYTILHYGVLLITSPAGGPLLPGAAASPNSEISIDKQEDM